MAKPFIVGWIETNEKSVECNFYASMGQLAYGAAVSSLFTGQFYAAGGAALVGGAAELAYNLSDCTTPPPAPTPGTGDCWKVSGSGLLEYTRLDPQVWTPYLRGYTEILSQTIYTGDDGELNSTGDIVTDSGAVTTYTVRHFNTNEARVRLSEAPCIGQSPAPDPPTHNPGGPIADPVAVTDPDTGCNWTIQATDAYVDDYGEWHTYYTVTADNDACGGPFAYWSSKDGPNFVPVPPDPGPDPTPPGPVDCCDDIKTKLDELKDCACKPEKPELWLHWRSLRFESDDYSPNGKSRLIKLLRYRGSSPGDVRRVADHWKDFRWTTGSTVVIHKGSPVGTPQVWARDADEGKRVIRHAFLEAGADADSVGEWVITGPSGSRTGVSTEVGLLCVDACWSATARRGSNGWPQAAVASPDP